jgi:hypothetical protein
MRNAKTQIQSAGARQTTRQNQVFADFAGSFLPTIRYFKSLILIVGRRQKQPKMQKPTIRFRIFENLIVGAFLRTYETRKKSVFICAFSSKTASESLCAHIFLGKSVFSYVHFTLIRAKSAKMHV